MSDLSDPRWELLPHDPEQFFGLQGEFDLRDLKRSYNRFIRRYKPERFPGEFKRIRAAYESLNDTLRYNLPQRGSGSQDWPVDLDVPSPPMASDTPSPISFFESTTEDLVENAADDPGENLVEAPVDDPDERPLEAPAEPAPPKRRDRVAPASPREVYDDLKSRPTKMPDDYIALALLADLVVEADSSSAENESFVDWILVGISDHPHDWGLARLLREYLSELKDLAEIPALLLRAVELLPPDRFQYTTERAWDRLLREAPFAEFSGCLRSCSKKLGRSVDHSQLVFYIHVLKLALWKADDDFLSEIQDTIEDHYHSLDSWAQEEYEAFTELLDYKTRREQFIQLGPCCERIDRAIRDWCLLPETEGDLSVLDCQYFLSMQGQRLLDEFPDYKDDFSHVIRPWDRIVTDVLDRLGDPAAPDESSLAQYARDFMIRITRRNERTFRYYRWIAIAFVALTMFVLTLVTSGAYAVRSCMKLFAEGQYLGAFWDGLICVATLLGGFVAALAVFCFGRKFSIPQYDSMRGELIKLIRVAPLRIEQIAAIIEAQEDEKFGDNESIDDTDEIAERLQRDAGLELFSLAQLCLNAADPVRVYEATVVESAAEYR